VNFETLMQKNAKLNGTTLIDGQKRANSMSLGNGWENLVHGITRMTLHSKDQSTFRQDIL